MIPRTRSFLRRALAALGLFVAAHATAQQARYCEVAFTFAIDGKPSAAPSVLVEYGTPADVTIDKPDRTGGWHFHIAADAPTVIRRATSIPIAIDLFEETAGEEFLRAKTRIGAIPGQTATIETIFGNEDDRKATFVLVANPKSDADVEAIRQAAGDGAE